MINLKHITLSAVLLSVITLGGCQSTYYQAMESVGIHKRDIMVDRLEDTQDAQEQAKQQFQSALEQFRSVVSFDGGDLESLYKRLNSEYEDSVSAAGQVRSRIDGVRSVSEALFDEWEQELSLYSNSNLRRSSQNKLKQTRQRYQKLMARLTRSEKQMQPVLNAFQDQVLFLKHNLNARAITALKGEFNNIKADIERLMTDMQRSIDESRRFVETLKQT